MLEMGSLMWIIVAALVVISVSSIIFCIVRGRGASHRMLIFSVSLLGVVAMICLGGEVVLNHFGMGWRCTPFNTMLSLGFILFIVILCFSMFSICEFIDLKNVNRIMVGCGFTSMLLVIFITLISAFFYFHAFSWHDGLTTYNDQTIVYANDQHGGSCDWRYYTHINDLIHGVEILQEDGWHGNPPRF